MNAKQQSTPFAIWETGGITEHLGGVYATQRLLELCHITPGQAVLDIGSGTGYTSCHLAREDGARVVAVDITAKSVTETHRRAAKECLRDQVHVLRADAHHLPFSVHAFDTVIAESVLVFCQATQVVGEVHRVLKRGGVFGTNELTLLKPPPEGLATLLQNSLAIQSYQSDEWQSILARAGFVDVVAAVRRMSLREQLGSHIKVDGVRGYLSAMVKGLTDMKISRVFVNRAMLSAARKFVPFVGYGLYVGRKVQRVTHSLNGIEDIEFG